VREGDIETEVEMGWCEGERERETETGDNLREFNVKRHI
jgi:hypothetical protein